MPTNEHLVLCGGVGTGRVGPSSPITLDLHGPSANVHLEIADISRRLLSNVPDALVDLLEIASYIYAADSAIPRGGRADAQLGVRWRRQFRFLMPVRLPDLWSSNPVVSALEETLSFLSEDDYHFEFGPLLQRPPATAYFDLSITEDTSFVPDEVILFSGGLDSLAGAIEILAANGKRVALVSHRSSTKIVETQKYFVARLQDRFGAGRILHVPVWATIDGTLAREQTHRTRSFLFTALGVVTAQLFGRDRFCFFENGVTSLNLPPVAQLVGARASRTTHPQALAGFRGVIAKLLGRRFDIENPFAWLTKSEVVERISSSGHGNLIRHTRSCTRVHDMTKIHPHCGQCSQCIDRRFAILAAGRKDDDPAEAYNVDLFLGERPPGPDREMALAYVRSASKINVMTDIAFFAQYGETSRVVSFFPETADTVGNRIFELHQRHAATICRVFDETIASHAPKLREGSLSADCLLSLVLSQREGGSLYPAPSGVPGRPATLGPEIRVAVDTSKKRVVFDRWGAIVGISAQVIIALSEPFRQAVREERSTDRYPFTESAKLARQTGCESNETLRRRILRCRNGITRLAEGAGDPAPLPDAVIESSQWHGYRLNPDRVRIVAISELSGDE
jgi:7-cyano-7-deazaguanine synthase in queuosine biosynthesis